MEGDPDPVLFCTEGGGTLNFYLRPSETKYRLKPLIEARGGIVSSKLWAGQDWIKLAAEDEYVKSDDYISTKYIDDCIAKETLLPMDGYRVKWQPRPSSPAHSTMSTSTNIAGRMKYSSDEDNAILSYIKKHPQKSYSGCQFWKKMECLKVTGHSWQSMKDRFLRKLVNLLPTYREEEGEITGTEDKKSAEDSKEPTATSDESISDFDIHLIEEADKHTPKEITADCTPIKKTSTVSEEIHQGTPANGNNQRRGSRRKSHNSPDEQAPSPKRFRENGVSDDVGNELLVDSDTHATSDIDSDSEADRVVAFVENIKKRYSVSAKTIVHLLYMHSGDFHAVLEHLRTEKTNKVPLDMVFWTTEDDEKLSSSDPSDISELCQKYGQTLVMKRQAFFS